MNPVINKAGFKKYLILLIVMAFSVLCFAIPATGNHVANDSTKRKILILNSFDAQSIKARKNKKELFTELVAILQKDLATEIETKTFYEPVVISEKLTGENHDSLISSFIQNNHSAKTIIIKNFDVWFEQTGVEVTEENGSKTRTASFDICSNVLYHLYDGEKMKEEKETKYREHFTQRNVASGFLSVGPDIVGKRKHAVLLMKNNAATFMRSVGRWLLPF